MYGELRKRTRSKFLTSVRFNCKLFHYKEWDKVYEVDNNLNVMKNYVFRVNKYEYDAIYEKDPFHRNSPHFVFHSNARSAIYIYSNQYFTQNKRVVDSNFQTLISQVWRNHVSPFAKTFRKLRLHKKLLEFRFKLIRNISLNFEKNRDWLNLQPISNKLWNLHYQTCFTIFIVIH